MVVRYGLSIFLGSRSGWLRTLGKSHVAIPTASMAIATASVAIPTDVSMIAVDMRIQLVVLSSFMRPKSKPIEVWIRW